MNGTVRIDTVVDSVSIDSDTGLSVVSFNKHEL